MNKPVWAGGVICGVKRRFLNGDPHWSDFDALRLNWLFSS